MEAWQRREMVNEWNQRKLMHISALYSNTNYDNQDNDREGAIREIERGYERIKAELMMSPAERAEIEKAADTDFMRAGRRAMARSLEGLQPPEMPGEQSLRALPG